MKTWKIGSSSQNDLVITELGVAPHHAELQLSRGQLLLRDLGTGLPTIVNDWRVRQKLIQPTDKLIIGKTLVDIDDLIIKEPKVWAKEIVSETTVLSTDTGMTKEKAAELLGVQTNASVEDILHKFNREISKLNKLLKEAPLPAQKRDYSQQIQRLNQTKSILLEGLNLENLPLNDPLKKTFTNNPIVNLNPVKPDPAQNHAPKKWFHNYPVLWGAIGALFAWSAFLMYERFRDSRADLIITQEARTKYDFLERNFHPNPLKLRNETGVPIQLLGFVAITYDSTDKGWRIKKSFKESPLALKNGEVKVIEIAGKVIFADIVFEYTDQSASDDPIRLQFAGVLSPDSDDFNPTDNALEIRLPNQHNPRTYKK